MAGAAPCPLTPGTGWGEVVQNLFLSRGGGFTKKYKKGFCIFRNKATRRPIMAPITSYSSSTATVSGFVGRHYSL